MPNIRISMCKKNFKNKCVKSYSFETLIYYNFIFGCLSDVFFIETDDHLLYKIYILSITL